MWTEERTEKNWYALFVKTGCEDTVKRKLEELFKDDFSFCVPKRVMKIRKKGICHNQIKTLFPGYVLMHGPLKIKDYYEMKKIPNLFFLLMNDAQPIMIPEEEIQPIMSLLGNDITNVIGESIGFYKNDKVYIKEGPLRAMEGIIEKIQPRKGRVKVRLRFGGQEKLVDLSLHLIQHQEL